MKMAMPSIVNPALYIVQRQYKDNIFIKNNLFNVRLSNARNLYRTDLLSHYGCVNAIEFSLNGEYLVSGGDDKRVLLWSVAGAMLKKGPPVIMKTSHRSNIFCLTFDSCNEKIFSGGNDNQVLIHEVNTGTLKTSIAHDKPVYGISIHPQNDDIIATAGDDGRILLYDIREQPSQDVQVVADLESGFHSVMFNPLKPRYLVTANTEEGIALWDCRKPKTELLRYDSMSGRISGISACFDCTGKKVLALRRRLPPVLYMAESETAVCQFYHPQYYNSCTMKTCCFAGDNDEYILSGSDDFNLYMWKIPQDDSEWGSSHMVLRGHRSIVNQVRYNNLNKLIASSGVEKMIKLWSSIPIGNWEGSFSKEELSEPARTIYSHEDYMSLVGNTDRITHDYSDQSTNEDVKMMAFFDSLIQKEIEGWDSQTEATPTTDSDTDEDGWPKIISRMFRNGRYNSDELKKCKLNRITQLISKKKNTLAKLAKRKSPSYVRKYHQQKNHNKRKSSKCKSRKSNGIHKKSRKISSTERESSKKRKRDRDNRPSKYFTRQSVRNLTVVAEDNSTENSLDTPSTSTGITNSERSIFRLFEEDSEDEATNSNETEAAAVVEENYFVNILPTPLNGMRDVSVNVLEVTEGESSRNLRSSTSSSTSHVAEEDEVSEDLETAYRPTDPVTEPVADNNRDDGFSESSDSDFEYMHTPKKRCVSVSDSGCGTGPSSSASTCSSKTPKIRQECSTNGRTPESPDGERRYSKYRNRWMRKARRSIRKKIGVESDED